MALNSFSFLIYFAGLFIILTGLELAKKFFNCKILARSQIVSLLIFSYFFILIADWRFCVCIAITTILTYLLARGIQRDTALKNKRCFLVIGIILLLSLLGYFKYTNFFIESFSLLFGASINTLNIILPIGISFYTFSAISYLLDVYWKRYDAVTNIVDFSLYIAFFPKLMSGPIVRGKDFFPQIQQYRGIEFKAITTGIQIFMFGLFKKIVLADHLGIFVDDVFFAPQAYNTITVIFAVISYSLQIYFDFSGYSDMAIGISKMIGFDFSSNFNLPYLANSFSDFWKRWHISLSSWFQEYLYFPLGGSRKGTWRTCLNLLIVMLISGLWHGAGFTFILWGFLYGITSCCEHLIKKKRKPSNNKGLVNFFKCIGIYLVVSLFWVPFRASSLSNMLEILKGCFTIHSGIQHLYMWTFVALFCIAISTFIATIKSKKDNLKNKNGEPLISGFYPVMNLEKFLPLCVFFIFCGLTIILGYFGDTAFIYGKF